MKKRTRFLKIALFASVLAISGGSGPASATSMLSGSSGCGFNTAGDYLCEGDSLALPPNPGQIRIPGYSGTGSSSIDIPPTPDYTPGDLNPGTVRPYVPITPIFELPPGITMPGMPVVPIIHCRTEPDTPVGSDVPVGASGGCDEYYAALRQRESSGNYQARRPGSQYWGAYQMGNAARQDAGVGHLSSEQFMNDPALQDRAIRDYHNRQWEYIENMGLDRYEGQVVGGRVMTRSAMIGGAHLMGVGGLRDYLESDGRTVRSDGLGTTITEYMDRFGGYDVSGCIG